MNTEYGNKPEQTWKRKPKDSSRGRLFAGLMLLVVGGALLLKNMDLIFLPEWLFSWPVILIAIGLVSGIKERFRTGFWLVPLLIGGLLLANRIDPTLHAKRYIAPFAIITVGLVFILRPKKNYRNLNMNENDLSSSVSKENDYLNYSEGTPDRRDSIDVTSIFGGVKKIVLSKNFKGGEIVSVMGGSEINLTQADFKGTITIDATNIMGGTKLIVPATWDVQSDVTAIFGGVDDKRQVAGISADPEKILILDGVCIFGGIEIRSF